MGCSNLKGIKACLSNPAAAEILDYLLGSDATPVLASILKRGLDLEELLRTPTIKALVGKYRNRIDEQLESLANDDKRREAQRNAEVARSGRAEKWMGRKITAASLGLQPEINVVGTFHVPSTRLVALPICDITSQIEDIVLS